MEQHNTTTSQSPPSSDTLFTAALGYAARGWCVMPVGPTKKPFIDAWTTTASRDPAQIAAWWEEWREANIGILTGARSQLAVLDVDPRNGGDIALDDFLHHHGPLPDTPQAISGGGGPHYYFACADDLPGCKLAFGLDLLITGQQVVAPPSLHASGRRYEWEASSHPDDVPLAPLPDWILAHALAKQTARSDGVDLPDLLPTVDLASLKLSPRIKFLIRIGHDPDNPTRYTSRSEAGFAVIQAMLDAGYDPGTIAAVMLDTAYPISGYVWQRKNGRSPFYVAQTRQWVAHEIARAQTKGKARTPPTVPDMAQHRNGTHAADAPAETPHDPRLVTTCADTITPAQVRWLWYPYIAYAMLCMVDGDPGTGKSLLLLMLAALLSRGYDFPDQTGKPGTERRPPQNVLLMTREDSLSVTIRPRLDADGADVSRIFIADHWRDGEGKDQPFTLKHLPLLAQELAVRPYGLVILDPIQSFFGAADMHRANETRPLMDGLAALAEQFQCAIVCVRHAAKPGEGIGKALLRGLGSVDLVGTARTALFVEQHPTEETSALMAQTKNNIGPKGRTQIFSKAEGAFAWERASRLTAEDLAGSGRGPNHYAFLEAVLWLEKRLEGGLSWPAADIEQEAEEQDIGSKVLRRAKKALRVVSAQMKGDIHQGWTWRLSPLQLPPTPLSSLTATDISGDTGVTGSTGTPDYITKVYADGAGDRDAHGVRRPVDPDNPVASDTPVAHSPVGPRVDSRVNTYPEANMSPLQPPRHCPGCGIVPAWLVRATYYECHKCHTEALREVQP